jgi:hypothetical protein
LDIIPLNGTGRHGEASDANIGKGGLHWIGGLEGQRTRGLEAN